MLCIVFGLLKKVKLAYQVQEAVKPQIWTEGERTENIQEGYNELIRRVEESLVELKEMGRESSPAMMANQVKNQIGQLGVCLHTAVRK